MAYEHASVVPRPGPARERDHGRAVSGGDEPAPQGATIGGRERHVLVRDAQAGGRGAHGSRVRAHVGDRDGLDHEEPDQDGNAHQQRPAQIAARPAAVPPPLPPERGEPGPEQGQPRQEREPPGVVVSGGAVLEGVVGGLGAGDHSEDADAQRQRRAEPRTDPRIGEGGGDQDGDLRQPAGEMIPGRRARLGLQERVVDDVDGDDGDRDEAEGDLGPGRGSELGHGISISLTLVTVVRSAT